MSVTRSYTLSGFEALVRSFGENPQRLYELAGMANMARLTPDSMISYASLALLLEISAEQLKQPYFGLLLAQQQSLEVLGVLPMIAAQYPSVGECIHEVSQSLSLHVSEGVAIHTQNQDDGCFLSFSMNVQSAKGTNQLKQFSVGHLAMFLEAVTGVNRYKLALRVTSMGGVVAASVIKPQYESLTFNATQDGIWLPAMYLTKDNKLFSKAISQHIAGYLQFLRQQMPVSLVDEVKEMIRLFLPTFDCSIDRVARALGYHPRNLQLKLNQAATSYSVLLHDVRLVMAKDRLSNTNESVTDIALKLGYSDIATFSRMFKKAEGLSPRQWQQGNANDQKNISIS